LEKESDAYVKKQGSIEMTETKRILIIGNSGERLGWGSLYLKD